MSSVPLIDVRLLSGGYEVTSDHNAGSLRRSREVKDATVFGQRDRVYRPGIRSAEYTLNGFFDGPVNTIHQAQLVATDADVTTIVAPDGSLGANAYSFEAILSDLDDFGGSIGDLAAFTASGRGTGPSFRGTILEAGETARSSSANGTGFLLSAVGAGSGAYAALHVIDVTGSPTLDVVVESDDNSGFTTATTRLTFAQASAIGAQFISDTSTVTDTYWRARWTFGGSGSVLFVVNFGIASA